MTDLNSVNLIGRLVKDAELRYTPNGTAHTIISIAVNRSVKNGEQWEDEASFIDVELWGNLAENVQKFSGRGKRVAITGALVQKRWKKDGQKRSKLCVSAHAVQFLTPKEQNAPLNSAASSEMPKTNITPPQAQSQNYDNGGGYDDDMDIPF